jgi:hypothetical protein
MTVWLGWYVVTRSPKNLLSWLTGLALWSVGGLFLNTILALTPLPKPLNYPDWLNLFFPFWSDEAFENGWVGWLQGWQVVPAIMFWHHATMLIRPGKMNWWRWARVLFGYIIALIGIWVLIKQPQIFADVSGDPLYLNTQKPGPLYIPFLVVLLLFTFFCLVNILRSMRVAPSEMSRRQLITMAIATIFAGLTAPAAFMAAVFAIPVPRMIYTVLLTISVGLIGYGVARYSALIEGRTIRRDFLYNATAMGIVVAVYALVTWVSVTIFGIPPAAFVFVIILVIISHNMIDIARHSLDSIFFKRENQQIRANLRILSNRIGDQDLDENVSLALDTICNSVHARYGLVVLFDNAQVSIFASYNTRIDNLSMGIEPLLTDDIRHIEPDELPTPLEAAALLIPFYWDSNQVGAMILGRPANSTKYSREDVELLVYPSDRLSDVILSAQRESEYIKQLSQIVDQAEEKEKIPVKDVENALRNLYDYAYLSDLPFAHLKVVNARLSDGEVTHLDRGKAVNKVFSEAVGKLRPDSDYSEDPPSREWYPYIILNEAYFEDKLNRDIMSKLYISEGTFNRTRRAAIRSVARVISEMEMHVQ